MSFTITKTFAFAASHQLGGLAPGHKCARLHGHNYRVTLELTGPTGNAGMVLDYGELEVFAEWLRAEVDHRHLNGLVDFNPTAELLAYWLHHEASRLLADVAGDAELVAVRVAETDATSAEFRP